MKREKIISRLVLLSLVAIPLCSCNNAEKSPTKVTLWNYYTGDILNTFNGIVNTFNSTVGKDKGIVIESTSLSNLSELEAKIKAAANKEVGSEPMANIISSYADTAYEIEKLDVLVDLDLHFSATEQAEFIDGFIEEGRIGKNGGLRILPVAKSTELFFINETDWTQFALANDLTYDDLLTMEDIARVSELYFQYTDDLTPEIEGDGRAFFGRDSMANFFLIASKELETEIIKVENGEATINIDEDIMRRMWDYYYVPFISGHYLAKNKFRTDDVKNGLILSAIGSTASSAYVPFNVEIDGEKHDITPKILPMPKFDGAKNVMIQQGAGMVVTKDTKEVEEASVTFLKWFTDVNINIGFAAKTSYMPVKKAASDFEKFSQKCEELEITLPSIVRETMKVTFERMEDSEMYASKAFNGGTAARSVLDNHLKNKAISDRASIESLLAGGTTLQDAIAQFNTNEAFMLWFNDFKVKMLETIE